MKKKKILLISKVLIATFIFVGSLFSIFDTQNHQVSAIDDEESVQGIIPSQIEFISLSQNGVELEEKTWVDENDPTNTKSYYQLINDSDYVELKFRLTNLEENIDYFISGVSVTGDGDDLYYSSADNGKEQTVIPYLYWLNGQDGDGEPDICDLYSYSYPFGSFYFRSTLGIVSVDGVEQAGNELEPIDDFTFYYDTSIEDPLELNVHTKDAKKDGIYQFFDGGTQGWQTFTGAELNAGVKIKVSSWAWVGDLSRRINGSICEAFGSPSAECGGIIVNYKGIREGYPFDMQPVSGGVYLSDKEINLYPGESTTFTIIASNSFGDLTILSSDSTVASTDKSALSLDNNSQTITVTANAVGTAKINVVTADNYEIYDGPVYPGQKRIVTINVTEKPQSQPETTDDNNQNDSSPQEQAVDNDETKENSGYEIRPTDDNNQESSNNEVANNDSSHNVSQHQEQDSEPTNQIIADNEIEPNEDSNNPEQTDDENETVESWHEAEYGENQNSEGNNNNAIITTVVIVVAVITPIGIIFFIVKW